jgi:hypothetical protein
MDRLAQQQDNAEMMEAQANNARMQANQQMISAVGSTATSLTGGMTSLGGVIPAGAPRIG